MTPRVLQVASTPLPGDGDAPFSLPAALEMAAREKGPVILALEAGRYALAEPLCWGAGMSNVEFRPATPGGEVIFDGGHEVDHWIEREIGTGGAEQKQIWAAHVPPVFGRGKTPKFFYVNGSPRERCRYPKSGARPAVKTASRLDCPLPLEVVCAGDTEELELVLFYDWVCRRLKIASMDPKGIDFIADRTKWGSEASFHIENMPLAFLEPGQWKFDEKAREIHYMPLPGESLENLSAFAGLLPSLLEVRGDDVVVENLIFRGIHFRHTGDGTLVNSNQADHEISAAIRLQSARHCRFEDCRFTNLSGWGLSFDLGCRENTVERCVFDQLGAGAIKANGAVEEDAPGLTGENRFIDNLIQNGGKTWAGAVGILLRHSAGNVVRGNEIAHFSYSGISCGWSWGYGPSISRNNLIENNHIHHLGGDRKLADMGGIYTLGPQPGTVIRGNLIHDITGKSLAWGIYLDEGSSDILVKGNIVHHIAGECLHIHYGRDNMVCHNVFAFGDNGIFSITRGTMDMNCQFIPGGKAATLIQNVLLSPSAPFFVKYLLDYEKKEDWTCISSEENLLQATGKQVPPVAVDGYHCYELTCTKSWDFPEWKAGGFDGRSLFLSSNGAVGREILSGYLNETAIQAYESLLT